jgi:predicted regulator of Ras-like GTPase activity (Roadblock/LC7/MglB family)
LRQRRVTEEMPPLRKKTVQVEAEEEQVDWAPRIEEPISLASLRGFLDKIKSRPGIIGYIVRGPTSASVDIKDPSKIIDYAALSAEAMESGDSLSETFELGKICSIVLEGKKAKILLLKKGEQELTIFMEKSVDHNNIYKELS